MDSEKKNTAKKKFSERKQETTTTYHPKIQDTGKRATHYKKDASLNYSNNQQLKQ